MKIKKEFYENNDVVLLANKLLGKEIYTNINGLITSGIISETEAYNGITDKASHAYNGKRTKRNEAMYERGSICYVYLCYGIHNLLNVVTGLKDDPKAILIRSIIPQKGINHMLRRRQKKKFAKYDNQGPGKISKSLGIDLSVNFTSLLSNKVWIEDSNKINLKRIKTTPRIGIEYAEEDALLPYRFILEQI